jgi:hypothetical protein
MRRFLLIALLLGLCGCRAGSQDTPLSQILIDGKGWEEVGGLGMLMRSKPDLLPNIPGIEKPLCNEYSPDGGTLFVGAGVGKFVWAYRVEKDGSLSAGQPYCELSVPRGQKELPVSDLEVDSKGRVYAVTSIGIQVFDQTGRFCGLSENPPGGPVDELHLVDHDLIVFCGKIRCYVRQTKATERGGTEEAEPGDLRK